MGAVKIESRIHCGHVLSRRETGHGVFTETRHEAGTRLARHAHASPHVAVLLQGSYFERIGSECFLRLPGDRVVYPEFLEHENLFGRLPSRCLNIESAELKAEAKGQPKLERLRELASAGKLTSLSAAARTAGYHPVYLSRLYAAALEVQGVETVEVVRFQRRGRPSRQAIDDGVLPMGRLEIARLDNDPSRQENGLLELMLGGGR